MTVKGIIKSYKTLIPKRVRDNIEFCSWNTTSDNFFLHSNLFFWFIFSESRICTTIYTHSEHCWRTEFKNAASKILTQHFSKFWSDIFIHLKAILEWLRIKRMHTQSIIYTIKSKNEPPRTDLLAPYNFKKRFANNKIKCA